MIRHAVRFILLLLTVISVNGCAVLSQASKADRNYTRTLFMAIDAVSLLDEAERIAVTYDVEPPSRAADIRDRAADLILEAEAVRDAAVDEATSKSILALPSFKSSASMAQLKRSHESAKQLLIEAQHELIRVQSDAGVLILTPEVLIPVEVG